MVAANNSLDTRLGLTFFFFFSVQGRILALPPGIEPVSLVLEAWSFNHWTTGEVPKPHFLPSLTSSLLSGYMRLY